MVGSVTSFPWFLWLTFFLSCFFLNTLQKNMYGGLRVLKQMKEADVKPDSQSFSILITNCNSEEDINMVIWNLCSGKSSISNFLSSYHIVQSLTLRFPQMIGPIYFMSDVKRYSSDCSITKKWSDLEFNLPSMFSWHL